jgi:hypothetical protein
VQLLCAECCVHCKRPVAVWCSVGIAVYDACAEECTFENARVIGNLLFSTKRTLHPLDATVVPAEHTHTRSDIARSSIIDLIGPTDHARLINFHSFSTCTTTELIISAASPQSDVIGERKRQRQRRRWRRWAASAARFAGTGGLVHVPASPVAPERLFEMGDAAVQWQRRQRLQ